MGDKAGEPLQGKNTYRLNVPAKVPARDFWYEPIETKSQ